jgi:hypothetical protein
MVLKKTAGHPDRARSGRGKSVEQLTKTPGADKGTANAAPVVGAARPFKARLTHALKELAVSLFFSAVPYAAVPALLWTPVLFVRRFIEHPDHWLWEYEKALPVILALLAVPALSAARSAQIARLDWEEKPGTVPPRFFSLGAFGFFPGAFCALCSL